MSNEKYIRWQGITLNQVNFVINLFLGLATASLGFSVSLLKDEKFIPTGKVKCLFTFSILSQLIALLFGIMAVICRTLDFRYTARIARKKFGEGESVKSARSRVKRLGKTTWFSFWGQIGSFGLGIFSLIVSILIIYSDKLF